MTIVSSLSASCIPDLELESANQKCQWADKKQQIKQTKNTYTSFPSSQTKRSLARQKSFRKEKNPQNQHNLFQSNITEKCGSSPTNASKDWMVHSHQYIMLLSSQLQQCQWKPHGEHELLLLPGDKEQPILLCPWVRARAFTITAGTRSPP